MGILFFFFFLEQPDTTDMKPEEVKEVAKEAELYLDGVNQSMPLYVMKPEDLQRCADIIEKHTIERRVAALMEQRDELLAAIEAMAINSEECLDFDECMAMLVSIDDYHKLMEAVARAKGEQ